jgi:hypothetical protein
VEQPASKAPAICNRLKAVVTTATAENGVTPGDSGTVHGLVSSGGCCVHLPYVCNHSAVTSCITYITSIYVFFFSFFPILVALSIRTSGIQHHLLSEMVCFPAFPDRLVHCILHLTFFSLTLQPQFGPWPTSMKLSISLRFSRS